VERRSVVSTQFLVDLAYWIETQPKVARRLVRLMEECLRDPLQGTGKPEALKGNYAGFLARRLTDEDRLVYRVTDTEVLFAQARFHYDD
jgi:toxin YoeB